MREAFVDALIAQRTRNPRIFVLDADCARSTKNRRFQQAYPDSFLNLGIAEQNMVGVAAGMALTGLVPVACSFAAMLVARAAEQILQSVAAQGVPVKLAGHYAGMSAAREGSPHHSISDLAFLRAVPNMRILVPADDGDVPLLTDQLLAGDGPGYIRLCREPVQTIEGATEYRENGVRLWGPPSPDVLLVGAGITVRECREAAIRLRDRGISASVLAILRLKPFPRSALLDAAGSARCLVTVEEHSWFGGLGGAVAEEVALVGGPSVARIGLRDRFTETGAYPELLDRYGLTAPHIERRAVAELQLATSRKRTVPA